MDEIAILGVGMHPWGKWGRNFAEYGVKAARDALSDAEVGWDEVQFVSGANSVRCGYPGYVSASTFANALGFTGCQLASSYAACASGATALSIARAQILSGVCDVALVVGAESTPKGFFAPNAGERHEDPDWLRFHLVGATNPTYFALYARRRMELYGDTSEDFAAVKVKNSRHGVFNPNARYTKEYDVDDIANSPMVADPLRLLEICATSDGGAALVVSSLEWAASRGSGQPGSGLGHLHREPHLPQQRDRAALFGVGLMGRSGRRDHDLQGQHRGAGLRGGIGISPMISISPRCTTCHQPMSSTGTST